MFYYLSGTVAHVEPYLAVIDCGGVGYACRTTSYTLSALKKGEKGKLFTYLSVRQDGVDLFGFATQEELNLFQQLTSVSGVGPKAALSILSASTPANLALSIITGDEKALTVAQGIGKKIAQRIILELKDKLAKGQTVSIQGESYGGSGITVIPENKLSEASAALAVLGYSQGEINLALKGVDLDALTLEQVIKEAIPSGDAGKWLSLNVCFPVPIHLTIFCSISMPISPKTTGNTPGAATMPPAASGSPSGCMSGTV